MRELKALNSSWLRRLAFAEPDLVDAEQVQLDISKALRQNERLISVQVFGNLDKKATRTVKAAFGELVQKYNWRLDRVQLEDGLSHWPGLDCPAAARNSHLGRWLRSNVGVRAAQEQLHERQYAVSPISLLPKTMELVGPKPTLIFRLVRRGNLCALCDTVVVAAAQQVGSQAAGRLQQRRSAPAISALPTDTTRPARKRRR